MPDMHVLQDILVEAERERMPLRFPMKPTMQTLITELFQRLGRSATPAEALAIAEDAGAHGAALMEIATLAQRRVYALRCKREAVARG